MSYLRKIEYKIVPDKSFSVIHNCPGCKVKTRYINTNHFRVNANGNKLDVWLIYQCEKCKHTLNLSIFERQSAGKIPQELYQKFLSNDEELANEYAAQGLSYDEKTKRFSAPMTFESAQNAGQTRGVLVGRDVNEVERAQRSLYVPKQAS